jgi:hypothetical protein
MPRDYQKFLCSDRVMIPRWLFLAVVWGGILWIGLKIFVPPSWVIQQLDSPDGKRSARLLRTRYLRENFVVRVRDGSLWRTAYLSPTITNDFRVDLGERLLWSPDSGRLYFRLSEQRIWGYDFTLDRDLGRDELSSSSDR